VKETEKHGKKHQPAANHWKTLII